MKAVSSPAHPDSPYRGTGEAVTPATLQRQVQAHLFLASVVVSAALLTGLSQTGFLAPTPTALLPQVLLATGVPWIVICALLWRGLPYHSHARFGAANVLTLYRAGGTVLLAGCIPLASQMPQTGFWWLSLSAVFLLTLDGLDGYLARRTELASAYGARFDMEVDAFLTLVISLLAWQSGEVGIWIVSLGLMRYAFILASIAFKPLNAPLFPSFRRKLICVVQLASLCAIVSPWIEPPWSTALGATACLLLAASFLRDTHWLMTQSS